MSFDVFSAGEAEARQIIMEALDDALITMETMCANNGQLTVFEDPITPSFQKNAKLPVDDGWEDVTDEAHIDFMGEIMEAGNQIMNEAWLYAQEIKAQVDEAIDLALELIL